VRVVAAVKPPNEPIKAEAPPALLLATASSARCSIRLPWARDPLQGVSTTHPQRYRLTMAPTPDQIRSLLQEISENLVNIIREREHSAPIDPAIPPLIVQVQQLQIAVGRILDLVAPRE
jgi:hypothetical protein